MIGSRSRLPNSGTDAPPRPDLFGKPASGAGAGHKHVVGIGELAISSGAADQIVTHALGSCIAVCLWDPVSNVAGLLHYLLPESKINPQRAVDAARDLRGHRHSAAAGEVRSRWAR